MLKRIEDYSKVLPIVEVYTAVQSEGSRQGYPTIVVRTSGCTHRCYFGEGGWCDSWYTSIHPEKGKSNSVPVVGVETPQGAITDQKMVDRHNKFRLNKDAIKKSIDYHNDYHIKPVLDKELSMVKEVEEFLKDLEIPDHKVWAMPAGDNREELVQSYPVVMDFVRDRGWRFTGRAHIMAFDTQREV